MNLQITYYLDGNNVITDHQKNNGSSNLISRTLIITATLMNTIFFTTMPWLTAVPTRCRQHTFYTRWGWHRCSATHRDTCTREAGMCCCRRTVISYGEKNTSSGVRLGILLYYIHICMAKYIKFTLDHNILAGIQLSCLWNF